MKNYCPQPQGQNCSGSGYSSLFIVMSMGKKIPKVGMEHKLKAFFWGAMSAKLRVTSGRTRMYLRKSKGKGEVWTDCPAPSSCSSCPLLSAMLTFLSGFFFSFFFSVLLFSQGYFGWRDVHLLWSCPGLSTWSGNKCMYIYRMLRQNEMPHCKTPQERLYWKEMLWMGVRSPLKCFNGKPCQGEMELAVKMIDFESNRHCIRKQISFLFP